MPYGQPYGIDQCATVTILMQHFHKFFGKFITGPYWNAKSETPNLRLNYPKLRLRRRVGLFNLSLDRFGFCNPRLLSIGITSMSYGQPYGIDQCQTVVEH